jgi:hypothetical protein
LGEVLPDPQGISDRQLTSDPAIRNNAGSAWSWGPKPPFVVKAWVGTKILQQLTTRTLQLSTSRPVWLRK